MNRALYKSFQRGGWMLFQTRVLTHERTPMPCSIPSNYVIRLQPKIIYCTYMVLIHMIRCHEINSHKINSHEINSRKINSAHTWIENILIHLKSLKQSLFQAVQNNDGFSIIGGFSVGYCINEGFNQLEILSTYIAFLFYSYFVTSCYVEIPGSRSPRARV